MNESPGGFWEIAALVAGYIVFSMMLLTAIIAVLVFINLQWLRKHKPSDLAVFSRLEPYTGTITNRLMLAITFLGKHQFLIPANLFLIFYFLLMERGWYSARVITISLSSLALMFGLKFLFRRKRPLSPLLQAARGLSFPSGHAIMSITFYGLLVVITSQSAIPQPWSTLLIIALVVLIAMIGFSRIYLRVHYTSDVIAGFTIGLVWLLVSLAILNRIETLYTN